MEFQVANETYRSSKLDAKKQFHLSRRLAPVVAGLNQAQESEFFASLADSISGLSDENCDYIIDTCMSVVSRQQGNAWAKILNERTKTLQFDDIDMGAMLLIAKAVIEDNLGSFFGGRLVQSESNPTSSAG